MGEAIKQIVHFLFGLIKTFPAWLAIPTTVILLAGLFLLGRCGVGGPQTQNLLWSVWPNDTLLDCPRPRVFADLNFEVLVDGEYRVGKLGTTYAAGDQVRLFYDVSDASWIYLFAIDAKETYHLVPKGIGGEAIFYQKGGALSYLEFVLNSVQGQEYYILISSRRKFNWSEIEGLIKDNNRLSRGPDVVALFDEIEDFAASVVYFANSGLVGQ